MLMLLVFGAGARTWTEQEGLCYTKLISQRKQIPSDFTHMWNLNLRNKTNGEKRRQTPERHSNTENTPVVAREEVGGRVTETKG